MLFFSSSLIIVLSLNKRQKWICDEMEGLRVGGLEKLPRFVRLPFALDEI